jgi:hypothetical protein
MHPKQIIDDFSSMGSAITLDGTDLFLSNPTNVTDEMKQFAKCYKKRLINYLSGDYSDKKHLINQTIDKLIDYMTNKPVDNQLIIDNWLKVDQESLDLTIQLMQLLYNNGWTNYDEPVANYCNDETDQIYEQLFNKAMSHIKGRAA